MTQPMTQQAPAPPSLYDLLAEIRLRLASLELEVSATRLALAKRRLPSGAEPSATLDALALLMQQKLDWHFEQLSRPIPLYHLTRNFSRKISALGASVETLLALMPNAHVFASGTGGRMIVPQASWDALPGSRQAEWLGATVKTLEAERQIGITTRQKVEDYIAKEINEASRAAPTVPAPQAPTSFGSFEEPSEADLVASVKLIGGVKISPSED